MIKRQLFALFLIFLFASQVLAQDFIPIPEDCATFQDDDGNGVRNDGCPQSDAFSSLGGGDYAANASDGVLLGYTTSADSTSINGTIASKDQTKKYNDGQIKLPFNAANATYYLKVRYRSAAGPVPIWVSTSPITEPDNAAQAAILPQANAFAWATIGQTNSYANFYARTNEIGARPFPLNGAGALYVKAAWEVQFDCFALVDAVDDPGACPSETPSGPAASYVLYKTSNTPNAWDHSDFTNANIVQWTGASSATETGPVCNLLWKSTGEVFGSCEFIDSEIIAATTTNDDSAIVNDDRIEFQFRDSTATTARDSTTYKIVINANASGGVYTANFPSGSASTSGWSPSVTRIVTFVAGTWRLFFTFTLPFTPSDDMIIAADFLQGDTDSGGSTSRIAFGAVSGGFNNPANWGTIQFSSITVPVSGDSTAPVLSGFLLGSATSSSLTASWTTDEDGTCVVEYGTATGVYPNSLAGQNSTNKVCTVAVPNLVASTIYFARGKTVDAAGNAGFSAEDSEATIAGSATHYVGATAQGSADCSSDANRCLLGNVWTTAMGAYANVGPGSVITLADGTYQGASSMLSPPNFLKGASTNPITIQATNDGQVTIDGQGVRCPIALLNDNDWFIVEGMNAKDSGTNAVVKVESGSDHNIFRRIVAWNCPVSSNCTVVTNSGGSNNLYEDIAAFGTGRKMFSCSQAGQANCTFRRTWGAWTQTTNTVNNPKMVYSLAYNNYNTLCENCIGTWHEENTASNPDNNRYGILASGGETGVTDHCSNARFLGSIAYLRSVDPTKDNLFGLQMAQTQTDCFTFEHVVNYIEPSSHSGQKSASLPNFSTSLGGPSQGNHKVIRNTWIGGTEPDLIGSDWTLTASEDVATVGAASNIWNGAGSTGARVCKRYVNGTLTSDPLWPWPMDARINAALTASGRNPADYFRGSGNTVTSEMETIFGTIPAECRE